MPIIAKGREFELCPVGLHRAKVKKITQFTHDSWGERVKFTFETDRINKMGKPFLVFHETTLNLSPKAKLSGVVESVLGRAITPDERRNGFDVETLIGMNCQVNVKHRFSKAGNEYDYVDSVITDNGNHQQQSKSTTVETSNEVDE